MKAVRTLFVFVIMMTLITSAKATLSDATALLLGDTDGDGEVCITDATKIQRDVAKITEIDNDCRRSADVDSDGIITIMDATSVQRWLAHFSVTYPISESIDIPADESNPAVITEPTVIRNHKTVTVDGTAFNISKIPDTITLDNTTGSTASFMLQNRLLPDPADVHIEISDCDSVRRIDYRDPRFKEYFLAADDRKGIGCDYLIRDNSGNEVAWVGAHLTNTAYPYQVNIRAFSGSTSFSVDFYYRNVLLKRTFVTVNLSAGYGNCDDTKALVREIENECWKPDMTDEEKINAFAEYIKSHYTLRQLKCVDGALYTALAARDLGLSSMLLYPKENGHPDLITYNLYFNTTVPGGQGTRNLVDNEAFISKLKSICNSAEYVLSVCTGSALLAKTGVLNNRTATSNKKAFEWVKSINRSVNWIEQARWTVDGKYYTSSGVSAGMDMSLGFISDLFGEEKAVQIARDIEYVWNRNKEYDFFNVTIDSITV